jgi:hypothetical protein
MGVGAALLDDFGTSEAVEHHRRLGEQIATKR